MCHHLISIFMILYMFSLGGPPMSTMGAPPSTNTYGAPMTGNLGAPVPPAGPSAGGSTDYASAMYNMMKPPSAGDIVGVKGPLPPGSNPNPNQGLANDPNLQGGGGTGGSVLPTLAETDLSIQCDPKFLKCTVSKLHVSQNASNNSRIPLGVICKPMAGDVGTTNEVIDIVDFGTTGIVRCKRCRTYINPYVAWAGM